jgi:hypothetical protein
VAAKQRLLTNGHALELGADASVPATHPTPGTVAAQRLIDPALFADPYAAANFIGNVLEASTETSGLASAGENAQRFAGAHPGPSGARS